MSGSRIPSPARSQGALTPRRQQLRGTRSVGSPARSTASGRLTAVIQFRENNKDSFVLSPAPSRRSVLNDDTYIEEPRRKSWWKKLGENSRDVIEVLNDNKILETNEAVEEYIDIEVLSQEKKNYTMDLPDSSDCESISSIVIPQRKLFTQKDFQTQNKFGKIIGARDTLAKLHKSNVADKTVNVAPKNLFNQNNRARTKPVFPAALLNISPNKTGNKTKEMVAPEVKGQARNLFGNRGGTKRKNMFANFIVSDSEEEIPEIQPKVFGFQKKLDQQDNTASRGKKEHSPTSSITTDIEMEEWQHLPSSTMVENQIEDMMTARTPVKRPRLSKLTNIKESEAMNNGEKESEEEQELKYEDDDARSVHNNERNKKKEDVANDQFIDNIEIVNDQGLVNNDQITDNKSTQQMEVEYEDHAEYVNKELSQSKPQNISIVKNKTLNKSDAKNTSKNRLSNVSHNKSKGMTEVDGVSNKTQINTQNNSKITDGNMSQSKVNKSQNKIQNKSQNKISPSKQAEREQDEIVNEDQMEVEMEEEIHDGQIEEDFNRSVDQLNDSQNVHDKSNEKHVSKTNIRNSKTDEKNLDKSDNENVSNVEPSEEEIEEQEELQEDSEVEPEESEEELNYDESEPEEEIIEEEKELEESENEEQVESEVEANENYENQDDSNVEVNVNEQRLEESEKHASENEEELEEKRDQEFKNKNQLESEVEANENEELEESYIEADENEDLAGEIEEEQVESDVEDNEIEEEQGDSNVQANENEVDQEESEVSASENEEEPAESEVEANEIEEEQLEGEAEANENDEELEESAPEPQIQDDSDAEDQENDEEAQNESEELQYESDASVPEEQNGSNVEPEQNDSNVQASENEILDSNEQDEINSETETPNVTHDTTGRNRQKKDTQMNSPEAILHDKTNQIDSFMAQGRNTSIRKTTMLKNLNIRPSLAPPRESTGISDGTRNSSAEGSGWDSHRTTRKTLRQTLGKDFTPRKSLRALVMEKSAKRQTTVNDLTSATTKFPQANSTELPEASMDVDYEENVPETNHDVSKRTRQTTLEMYLQKIKKQNFERKLKMEEAVRNSLKTTKRDVHNPFKVPAKPLFSQRKANVKPAQAKNKAKPKSTLIPLDDLPQEVLTDMKYKPPKRFQPSNASWITKRLYKFLESKLESKYDYKARVRAEKLVESIYHFAKDLRRLDVASIGSVDALKQEMARLDVVRTHFDFYQFFHDYMPREIRVKVVPDVVNKITMPRHGVFSDILRGNTVQG